MKTYSKVRKAAVLGSRYIGKSAGKIQQRVQCAGPEHFGIVSVDCAKRRSKWMLCDYYGRVIVEPTCVEHNSGALKAMTDRIAIAFIDEGITDAIVAIEMTGVYHRSVQRACRKAGFDTRTVHPFASKHYRQALHPDSKTDDHDLEAIFHAAIKGYGLEILPVSETYQALQFLSRHRVGLVRQRARLQVQIRALIHQTMPGYADLFDSQKMFDNATVIAIAVEYTSAENIRRAGSAKIAAQLAKQKHRFNSRTIERIVAWAATAADAAPLSSMLTDQWKQLNVLRELLSTQISETERKLANYLVKTPYSLLLSVTGINVVSAAALAGEAGPIEHYASATAINGRAGLFPSRYQSDEVDRANGAVARTCNRKLRVACLVIATNLIKCNSYYRGLAALMATRKVAGIDRHCRIANRAMRMVFQLVGGRQVWRGNGIDCECLMEKLLEFDRAHKTPIQQMVQNLEAVMEWIPTSRYTVEAKPLTKLIGKQRRGPVAIGELLVPLRIRLGVPPTGVQPSEEVQLRSSEARGSD